MKALNILKKIFNLLKKLFKLEKFAEKPTARKFGWKKDSHDPRDFKYKIIAPHDLPPLVDLRDFCPPVYDQLDIGSCVGNGLAAAYQFEEIKQGKENFIPSRLFIYYNARAMEGTCDEDAGAQIRDGVKTLAKEGVCPETMWEYNTRKFKNKPTPDCYKAALDNQILEYQRITPHTLYEVKHCLSEGFPVVFGITLFSSFMTEEVAKTGMVPVPKSNEEEIGGHCIVACGYDDSKECLIVRNSWGSGWGINGYFFLPYWYISTPDVAADFWTIRLVE